MIRPGGDLYNSERKGRCPQVWFSARKWFALRGKKKSISTSIKTVSQA